MPALLSLASVPLPIYRLFPPEIKHTSITAHVTAMFIPFLTVIIAAGAPPALAVLSLTFFSSLSAALTHYGAGAPRSSHALRSFSR